MYRKYYGFAATGCWVVVLILGAVLLSGCGLLNGPSDYIHYSEALSTHATAESSRIKSQSQAIVNSLLTAAPKTDTERSLLAVIGMMEISQLHPSVLGILKPTTGYDVLDHNVAPIFGTVLTGALGYWSYGAIKALGGVPSNQFNLREGDVNATKSFNPTTTTMHQTSSAGAIMNPKPVAPPTVPVTTAPVAGGATP